MVIGPMAEAGGAPSGAATRGVPQSREELLAHDRSA
jgi:hypothetical protein